MNQTLKVSFGVGRYVKQDGLAYRDEGQWAKPLGLGWWRFQMKDVMVVIVKIRSGEKGGLNIFLPQRSLSS